MKYRVLAFLGLLALGAGSLVQAQDYDDIYYDASKAPKAATKTKVEKPVKTIAVYGEVPTEYKVVAQSNYRVERDEDEYNRRGAYDPTYQTNYEIDINGDTIYFDVDSIYDDESFANTRRIERFYNPDIVILSDDDDLVELYYDESPTINLVVGSDWGYASYGWASSYYPWYTGWYSPWYVGWYDPWAYSPWYYHGWHRPYHYGLWYSSYWGWNYNPWWSGRYWGYSDWGWHWGHNNYYYPGGGSGHHSGVTRPTGNWTTGHRAGLATNRNGRSRVDAGGGRNSISARGTDSSRSGVRSSQGSRGRTGYATSRGSSGNMGSRNNSGVSSRNSRSYSSGSSYSGSSRSGSSYSGSRSGGSSYRGGSYSSGSSHSSGGGSYSSGSSGGSHSGGGGGGSHGGSSGGGGHRR